jgi:Tfp pilus assembly protein PilF
MRRTQPTPFLAASSLFLIASLAACGGSADAGGGKVNTEKGVELTDKGMTALHSGDPRKALESLEKALGQLEPGTPEYMRAKAGEIEALIQVDAARAKSQLLALGPSADADLYATVGNKMCAAGKLTEATEVLDAGIKLYSESPELILLKEKVIAEAQKSGDPAALEKLKGLGYIGD